NGSPIADTSYDDTDLSGGDYTYLLRALDTYGLESGPSAAVSASVTASSDSSSSSSGGCFMTTARNAGPFRGTDEVPLPFVLAIGALAWMVRRN
ncbi:MAG: hypothetical protein JSV84_17315, partial [Gemmatimonadota bacterium]